MRMLIPRGARSPRARVSSTAAAVEEEEEDEEERVRERESVFEYRLFLV